MELRILGESYRFSNDLGQVKAMFDLINEKLDGSEYYFSHFCIDNVEIYDEFETYITDHLNDIQVISVVAKTITELTNEVLLSLEQYLINALPEIELLATNIYQNSINTTSERFTQFIEGLVWISDAIANIDSRTEKPSNWNQVIVTVTSLQQELLSFEGAINNQDAVLIADIIQYEILPILKTLQQDIALVVDSEVNRNDTN